MELVPSFVELLQPFRQQMTSPTFASLLTVLAGWVLCRRHTVSGALCCGIAAGAAVPKHFSAYHRVFSAARWSLDGVGIGVLSAVLAVLACAAAAGAVVFLVVDDTLCRRKGRRVWGAGMHYDPLLTGRKLSNANGSIKSRGHCWVVLGAVVCFPFRPGHCYCLPVLFRLCLNKKSAARHGRAYRSRPELAREMAALACGHFPHRRFHLLADSAYAGQDTLRSLPPNCELTARWVLNSVLHAPAAPKPPGRKGPQPKRGPRLPGPRAMLDGPCARLDLDVFGLRGAYRVADASACLRTVPGRVLRVVATEPLTEGGRPRPKQRAVFYSTVSSATARQVLEWYAMRWGIEVAFRDAKQELGCGQPRCRTRDAARRSTPTLMLLYSAVVLWFAKDGHRRYRAPYRPWYRSKSAAGFADMLNTLRADCLSPAFSQAPHQRRVSREGIHDLLAAILTAA